MPGLLLVGPADSPSEALAKTADEWVVFAAGEGRWLPGGLERLRAELDRAGDAWACWVDSSAPAEPSLGRFCEVVTPPPGERLAFRVEKLRSSCAHEALEREGDALGPWAAFLTLAEHGPVHVARTEVASFAQPVGVPGLVRDLDALRIHSRMLGGGFYDGTRVQLVAIAGQALERGELRTLTRRFVERVERSQPRLFLKETFARLIERVS